MIHEETQRSLWKTKVDLAPVGFGGLGIFVIGDYVIFTYVRFSGFSNSGKVFGAQFLFVSTKIEDPHVGHIFYPEVYSKNFLR